MHIPSVQLVSLAVRLLGRPCTRGEKRFLELAARNQPTIEDCLRLWGPSNAVSTSLTKHEFELGKVLLSISAGREVSRRSLSSVVMKAAMGAIRVEDVSALLTYIYVYGLSPRTTRNLALAMRDSGIAYDYRNNSSLNHARILCRYPTGGLSEKEALILPSLISSFSREWGIASTYLVAKSLSFTGGTWDKLNAIAGFRFRKMGKETLGAMRSCGVAMVVTQGGFNPADRLFYHLRSLTATVGSFPLIVSSIASKFLALPPDRLLLDIRFGAGAFLRTKEDALKLAKAIEGILREVQVSFDFVIRENLYPTGMAVGNALEVVEALILLSGGNPQWDTRALHEQRSLALESFSKLMHSEFPSQSVGWWKLQASNCLRSGQALESFFRILKEHSVDESMISDIRRDPMLAIGPRRKPFAVKSHHGGVLVEIDQKLLGEIVNFWLSGSTKTLDGSENSKTGVLLKKRVGDPIRKGETICLVYSSRRNGSLGAVASHINQCFKIV